jgi:hypothetical protein
MRRSVLPCDACAIVRGAGMSHGRAKRRRASSQQQQQQQQQSAVAGQSRRILLPAGTDSARIAADVQVCEPWKAQQRRTRKGFGGCSGRAKSSYKHKLRAYLTNKHIPSSRPDRQISGEPEGTARMKKTTTLPVVCAHPSPIWPPQHRDRQDAYRDIRHRCSSGGSHRIDVGMHRVYHFTSTDLRALTSSKPCFISRPCGGVH